MQRDNIEYTKIEKVDDTVRVTIQEILKEEPIRISTNIVRLERDVTVIPIKYINMKETNPFAKIQADYEGSNRMEGIELFENKVETGMIAAINNIAIATTNLAMVQQANSYMIAKSILDMSYNLSSSIQQLVDEMERKNKLDEFYMLLDKIEEYEDKLVDLGCIEEAYDNLKLIQYPTISLDERAMRLLLDFDKETLKKILAKTNKTFNNPIRFLIEFLTETKWWLFDNNRIFISGRQELQLEEGFAEEIVEAFGCKRFEGNTKLNGKTVRVDKIILEEPLKASLAWVDMRYNALTEKQLSNHFKPQYFWLTNEIDKINREIQLTNLRCLYMELRNAVREYKIRKAF